MLEQLNSLTDRQKEELNKMLGQEVINHFLVYDFDTFPVSDFTKQLEVFIKTVKESE